MFPLKLGEFLSSFSVPVLTVTFRKASCSEHIRRLTYFVLQSLVLEPEQAAAIGSHLSTALPPDT